MRSSGGAIIKMLMTQFGANYVHSCQLSSIITQGQDIEMYYKLYVIGLY